MRIVWAAAYYGQQRGSFVPVIERVAQRAIARGDSFDVVLPDLGPLAWHESLRELGAGVHLVRPHDARAAARATVALQPDVAHAHFDGWFVTVTLALWLTRARVLWHLHSTFQPDGGPLRFTWRRAIKFRLAGRRVARFITVNAALAAQARQLGVPARKLSILPNAIDGDRYHAPSEADRAAARARLGLDARPALAFFGRDPAIKGADVMAAALPAAGDVTLVAVATPPEAVALLRRAGRVIDVPLTDDIRSVLWAVDAVAIPSRGEGMPYVALEALACGIPVVASALPWALELAAVNEGVRIAPVGDSAALAGAVRLALASPGPVSAGSAADLDTWTTRVLALYADDGEGEQRGASMLPEAGRE